MSSNINTTSHTFWIHTGAMTVPWVFAAVFVALRVCVQILFKCSFKGRRYHFKKSYTIKIYKVYHQVLIKCFGCLLWMQECACKHGSGARWAENWSRERGLPLSSNAQDQLQQFTKPTAWRSCLKCYQAFDNWGPFLDFPPRSVQPHAKCKYVCVSNCARVT